MPEKKEQPTTVEVTELLKGAFHVPTGPEIVRIAIDEELGERADDAEWVKENFSGLIERMQIHAYEVYLTSERKAGGAAVQRVFHDLAGPDASGDEVLEVLKTYFHSLDRFFLSLTQGRRPRAGNAFEQVIRELFTKLGYPFSQRPPIDGIPDFLLPSEQYYRKNPLDCVIFTVKRTLRERWRQIVTEGTRSLGFYLGTIDEKVSDRDLGEMMRGKIHLVVPVRLKEEISHYKKAGNVLSFETFFDHHLDPAMQRWKAAGAI